MNFRLRALPIEFFSQDYPYRPEVEESEEEESEDESVFFSEIYANGKHSYAFLPDNPSRLPSPPMFPFAEQIGFGRVRRNDDSDTDSDEDNDKNEK